MAGTLDDAIWFYLAPKTLFSNNVEVQITYERYQ
jgi:hypothetical protein